MLKKLIDFQYKLMEKYPSIKPLKPIIDATDNFFYGTPSVTTEAPHVRDGIDIKRYMIVVLFAVLPCAVASVYFFGLRTLVVILASYIAGGITEVLFCIIRKEEVTEGFLITGILFPLILPPGIPIWMVVVGIVVGVIFGKEVFGGTGKNPFNAAIVSRCFLYLCFPTFMVSMWISPIWPGMETEEGFLPKFKGPGGFVVYTGASPDATTEATPLSASHERMQQASSKDISSDEYTEYIGYVKNTIPSLVWGNRAGSMGETSAFLIILGSIFLIIQRISNWRTTFSMLFSAAVFSFFLYEGKTVEDRFYLTIFSLLSGGMLFGAAFMATDPVTGPVTQIGRYVYGGLIGMVAILIRRFSGFHEGVMFAILLMNIFAPLIDEVVIKLKYRRYSHRGKSQ